MLPEEVMEAIRQYRGLDENDTSQDEEINNLSLYNAINEYLGWESIYGYTNNIVKIAEAYGAKTK